MSPGSCSLMLTLLVSSFGQAHSPSFLPYPCWLASFPCYARAHSSERRWAGMAEVNGVLRLVGARCLSRFTAPSISRWTKPLPAHCAGPAGGRKSVTCRPPISAAGYAGAYAPRLRLAYAWAKRGLLRSARVYPLGRARPSGASGPALLPWVPPGDFDHTCRRGLGVVHIRSTRHSIGIRRASAVLDRHVWCEE